MGDYKKTVIEILTDWLGIIVSIIIVGVYIAWGLIYIEKSGKSPTEIIGEGAIIFFMGLSLTQMLKLQGLIWGEKDRRVIETNDLHGKTVMKASPLLEYGEEFVQDKNESAITYMRTQILFRAGIKYKDHFDEDGMFKDNYYIHSEGETTIIEKRINAKNIAIDNALNVKVTMITFNELTSEGTRASDPNYLGKTRDSYMRNTAIKDVLLRLVFSFTLAYYGYQLIEEFSREDLIYKAIQISIILSFALIQLFMAYLFITGEARNRTINKINLLEEFYNKYKDRPKATIKPLGLVLPVEETPVVENKNEGSENHGSSEEEIHD